MKSSASVPLKYDLSYRRLDAYERRAFRYMRFWMYVLFLRASERHSAGSREHISSMMNDTAYVIHLVYIRFGLIL